MAAELGVKASCRSLTSNQLHDRKNLINQPNQATNSTIHSLSAQGAQSKSDHEFLTNKPLKPAKSYKAKKRHAS